MRTLRSARRPGSDVVDLEVDDDGVVRALRPASTDPVRDGEVDLGGRLTLAAVAEPHAHLDKAYTADLIENPAGDLPGAIEAWRADAGRRSPPEILRRARRGAEVALGHGATAARTHVDVSEAIGLAAVQALVELRQELTDRLDLQVVALAASPLTGAAGAPNRRLLDQAVEAGVDLVGGCPHLDDDPAALIELICQVAATAGLGVDLHVDETLDASAQTLEVLARHVIDTALGVPVTASHCVSLGMRSPAEQLDTARLVARAGIGVVTLPQTNLFLQARGVAQAPPRGLTAVAALGSCGVRVAAGGDNVSDPFNVVGRNDPLETASLMVMAAHLSAEEAYEAVSAQARSVMGLPAAGTEVGQLADLLVLDAPTVRAAVAEASPTRTVVRRGQVVARSELVRHDVG